MKFLLMGSYVHIIFSSVATFLEIAAHSVDHMFSLYFDYLFLVISRFGYESWIWVLIASVPDLCIDFAFIQESQCRFRKERVL